MREVEELANEWRALAERDGNPFVTPDWFLSWLRAYGPEYEPRVAVVRDGDGGLRGVVPLVASREGRRTVVQSCRGDRFQPVAGPGDAEAVASAAAELLAPADRSFDSIVLDNVDSAAGWWRAFADRSPAGLAVVKRPETELPYVQLEGLSWDDYLSGRSRQFRNQLGRKMRALRRDHEVRLRRTSRADELARDLDSLFALHKARWADRGDASGFDKPAVRRFHDLFAHAALERGWLRLYLLEVDGTAIAAQYGWLIGRRWSYLQAGLDPAWSRYSPGFLMLGETIREATEQGATEYDLLLGDEGYKFRFATASRHGRSIVLVRRTDPARISNAVRARARGAWRRLPPGARRQVKRLARRR